MISLNTGFVTQCRNVAKAASGAFALSMAVLLCGCEKEATPELHGNEMSIRATVSPSEILVGDSAELLVTVFAPLDSRVETLDLPSELELLNRSVSSDEVSATHERIDVRFELTSFELGEYALTNGLVVVRADGSALTNALENVSVNVISSLASAEDQTLAELKPPIKEKGTYTRVFYVMGIVAVTALVVAGLVMWLMSRCKQIAAAPKPIIPAHVIAKEALRLLKERQWIESDNSYEFYSELSTIWRYYLENRFSLNAPESTTEELAELLTSYPQLQQGQKLMLKEFMEQADRIKFARETGSAEGMQQAYALCGDFVDSTKKEPEVAS